MAALPPPLEPGTVWSEWSLSPLALVGCASAGAWYLAAMRRARRRGRSVSARRIACFGGGIVVLTVALTSGIDTYAEVSFPVHMIQHLLLAYVAPPLLALGSPVALGLAAAAPRTALRITARMRSQPVRALAHPLVGFALFAMTPIALHLSPLYDLALREPWVHALEHAVLLATGAVYWWPLVGADPMPHRPSHGIRVLSLLMLLPTQGFLALALFSADEPTYAAYASLPPPFGTNALADQRSAAALMWVVGSVATITAIVFVAARWRRSDEAGQTRLDAIADARGTRT